MNKFIYSIILLLAIDLQAQDGITLYKQSDSLYLAKDYKGAAMANLAGVRAEKGKDNPTRYAYAAGAWAKAGMPDSAFAALNYITFSNKASVPFIRGLATNKNLAALKTDARWNALMEKATQKAAANYSIEEMIYGHKEGLALSMMQLSPKGKPNGKAIIRIVAGNWISSYQSAENYVMSSYDYLQRGFTVYQVMVGSQPRFTVADQVADAKRAVRYIRYHAKKLGIDPNHIGMEGGSAGGHLTLNVALADEYIDEKATDPIDRVSSRVQAAAVLFPPTDFLNWGAKGFNFINARTILEPSKVWGAIDFKTLKESTFTYVPVTDTAERNKLGIKYSPVYAVSADDPPIFIVHGAADPTVPIQQSISLVEELKAKGVTHRFVVKPGGKHSPADMMPEWGEAVDWFQKYLK